MIAEFQEGIKLRKHKKAQNSKPVVQSKAPQQKSPSVHSLSSYLDGSDGTGPVKWVWNPCVEILFPHFNGMDQITLCRCECLSMGIIIKEITLNAFV